MLSLGHFYGIRPCMINEVIQYLDRSSFGHLAIVLIPQLLVVGACAYWKHYSDLPDRFRSPRSVIRRGWFLVVPGGTGTVPPNRLRKIGSAPPDSFRRNRTGAPERIEENLVGSPGQMSGPFPFCLRLLGRW